MIGSLIEEEDFDPLEPTSEELLGEWDLFVQRYGWEQARLRWLAIAWEERERWRKDQGWPMASSRLKNSLYEYPPAFWTRFQRLEDLKHAMWKVKSERICFFEHAAIWVEPVLLSQDAVLAVPSPLCRDDPPLPDAWANRVEVVFFASSQVRFYLACMGDSFTFVRDESIGGEERLRELEALWAPRCAPLLAERGFVLWPATRLVESTLINQEYRVRATEMVEAMMSLARDDVAIFLKVWGFIREQHRFTLAMVPPCRHEEAVELARRLDVLDPLWRARWTNPVWCERWVLQVTEGRRQDLAWPVREAS